MLTLGASGIAVLGRHVLEDLDADQAASNVSAEAPDWAKTTDVPPPRTSLAGTMRLGETLPHGR